MKVKVLASLRNCCKAGAVAWKKMNSTVWLALCLLVAMAQQAHAIDLFATGKQLIDDTLGSKSTIVWVLYILEALGATYSYIKTKNLAIFGGIVAVMIYLNVVFGIIPS
ncbi:type IV conjugative transfer system pilin TraA [Pantoea cypripedii]|uniref:Uncharacterized protein n=1 Tax=Pantoea cypripedii TaxID=55209 RepID=A0A1X1EKL5_PANCY|nr:type IV conjugative transfer system pilin TraA [Pantoea cypripedii]MBP2199069.1 type IV conjugative transfer system pilin TraA [Pantoea cypripedii]ORM89477.1 hypothetical protein HA50_22885 [Pantoea cypripedii]